jgi:hypothetical protein
MAYEVFSRHPFCTCPEGTFLNWPDRVACSARARARDISINPHPVIEIEDIRAMRSVVAGLFPRRTDVP